MDILSSGQSKIYFRKVTRMDSEEISLDADMIRLLIAIDETKEISQVADEVGMDMATLNKTITKLLKIRLIEPVAKEVPSLSEKFLEALKINLSKAIGPMAEFVIEDVAGEMNFAMSKIPKDQAPELISNIAVEIPDEDSRIRFKKTMIELIKKDRT